MSDSDDSQEVVEIYVPNSDSIEDFFTLKNKEKLKVIQLGLEFYKQGNTKIQYWNNKDWEDKISSIKTEHKNIKALLQSEVDNLNNYVTQLKNDFTKQKSDLQESIQTDYDTRYNKQIVDLREQQESLRNQRDKWNEKYNSLFRELDDKYQVRLSEERERSDKLVKGLREDLDREKERYLQQLTISQNSTLKGQQGEEFTFKQLNLLFPSSEILDTHNESGRGDFIVRKEDIVMMVENKNYSKNVQKSEIDKFYRDLDRDSNNDIQCAVLVSMHTGICGREDFEFEVRNNKPILFLHKLSNNFTNLELAFKFFKLILNQKDIDLSNKEVVVLFKNIATSIKRNFKKLKKQVDKFHSDQTDTLIQTESHILELYSAMKIKF
jgi:hypothetical protein